MSLSKRLQRQRLIEEALKRPGIRDLMDLYGQYEQVVKESDAYLGTHNAPHITSTSNQSGTAP